MRVCVCVFVSQEKFCIVNEFLMQPVIPKFGIQCYLLEISRR